MVVVGRYFVVLACEEFLRMILLHVCKVSIQAKTLLEILYCLHASDVLEEIEVSKQVDTSEQYSIPMHALQLNI